MSYKHQDRVVQTLQQIEKAILLLEEWNKSVCCADDYLLTPEGTRNLAASCMLVEAIGEAYKKIDAMTDGELLPLYPSIPWKAVKGIRDHIAHGYFEIDADIIYETIKNDLSPLLEATRFFLNKVLK
ncbi:MAG TPA: DUF86 domain-containing protein [Candidatus Bacteroides merdigallinarum]|uniref:DUF86 domain-containing protein n=1 Tax=Candidatus Bacteroides merdigallinarum TaxID=2838473 RepID=A0A9D2E9W6_9BACE|nr:DUF86 domain-containing protein [Candidatus Bacteroides merdigallinarum]